MTATDEEVPAGPPAVEPLPHDPQRRYASAIRVGCPYLVAAGGGWRGIHPTKDHRCGATLPMAALAAVKQRDICLTDGHRTCATYGAARDLELASAGAHRDADDGFWPDTRTTVLALEPARTRIGVLPVASGRHGGQALLVGLMGLAFLVLVVARTTPPSSGGATPSAAAGLAASGGSASASMPLSSEPGASTGSSPGASPFESSAAPSATPGQSASGPPGATAKPKPTAIPANAIRYKVKSGDTLSSIASKYGTTVKKLKAVNGLKSNIIRVGQVLVIP